MSPPTRARPPWRWWRRSPSTMRSRQGRPQEHRLECRPPRRPRRHLHRPGRWRFPAGSHVGISAGAKNVCPEAGAGVVGCGFSLLGRLRWSWRRRRCRRAISRRMPLSSNFGSSSVTPNSSAATMFQVTMTWEEMETMDAAACLSRNGLSIVPQSDRTWQLLATPQLQRPTACSGAPLPARPDTARPSARRRAGG